MEAFLVSCANTNWVSGNASAFRPGIGHGAQTPVVNPGGAVSAATFAATSGPGHALVSGGIASLFESGNGSIAG